MADALTTKRIEGGPARAAFLHGLMGRGQNFTTAAKAITDQATSLLIDLPNHGASPWTERVDYLEMADAVAQTLRVEFDGPCTLVGHSMGGKVAMCVALTHPDLVERLVVVDISPVDRSDTDTEFPHLLGSLRSLDLSSIATRGDAADALREAIPNDTTRGFLLQNLRRTDDGWEWQLNLELLYASLDAIAGWPEFETTYEGPTLWIAGERSNYVTEDAEAPMRALFPEVWKTTVKDAGHWVHSEQPAVFAEVLNRFLQG